MGSSSIPTSRLFAPIACFAFLAALVRDLLFLPAPLVAGPRGRAGAAILERS